MTLCAAILPAGCYWASYIDPSVVSICGFRDGSAITTFARVDRLDLGGYETSWRVGADSYRVRTRSFRDALALLKTEEGPVVMQIDLNRLTSPERDDFREFISADRVAPSTAIVEVVCGPDGQLALLTRHSFDGQRAAYTRQNVRDIASLTATMFEPKGYTTIVLNTTSCADRKTIEEALAPFVNPALQPEGIHQSQTSRSHWSAGVPLFN